jgi:hypothetical protein
MQPLRHDRQFFLVKHTKAGRNRPAHRRKNMNISRSNIQIWILGVQMRHLATLLQVLIFYTLIKNYAPTRKNIK